MSIEKFGKLLIAKLLSNMISICSVGNALLKSSFNTHQSVNGPTPGDYKLQNPIKHRISDRQIIKEVV